MLDGGTLSQRLNDVVEGRGWMVSGCCWLLVIN
jgi:hypothetical protein